MNLKDKIEQILLESDGYLTIDDLRIALGENENNYIGIEPIADSLEELQEDYIEHGILIDTDFFNYIRVLISSKRNIYPYKDSFTAKETLLYVNRYKTEFTTQGSTYKEALEKLECIM